MASWQVLNNVFVCLVCLFVFCFSVRCLVISVEDIVQVEPVPD